uniref:Splicing factor, arginine/serine-rich 15 n=1 Tax=Romanomermis culicivorax TaxID=13658 RepID=A0A915IBJ0_ROMCU
MQYWLTKGKTWPLLQKIALRNLRPLKANMMSNEDAEILKQFSQELASLYDSKPPVSKAKMVQLTKSAMKGIKFYKHVVMAVEKFIHRCKPEYKLPGLYVIDSIVRQSRHQFGTDKDVFAPRFCKNLENTLQVAASLCADEDRAKVVRIMNLWLENNVFPEETISPILADFKSMDVTVIPAAEEQSIALEKAKSRSENKTSKNIPEAPTPSSNPEKLSKITTGEKTTLQSKKENNNNNEQEKTEFLQQIQKLTSSLINQQKSSGGKKSKTGSGGDSDRKLTKKILSQYDYSDDDGDEVEELEEDGDDSIGEVSPDKLNAGQNDSDLSLNFAHAAQNLLNNPQILHQIQKMQQTITRTNSNDESAAVNAAAPPPPPVPAPTATFDFRGHANAASNKPVFDNQAYPPPAEPLPPGFDSSGGCSTTMSSAATIREDRDERRRVSAPNEESTSSSTTRHSGDRDRRKRSSRDRSRSRSRDRKRKHRSRSRSKSPATAYSKRHKSTTSVNNNNGENASSKKDDDRGDRDRDRELYSRTLWFGKIPQSCEPDELKEILKDYGEPVSIDLIPPRGCAYVVMPDRKTAYKVLDSRRDLKLQNRILKKAWAMGKGVKNDFEEDWDADNGVTHIPWDRLRSAQPAHVDFLSLWVDGGTLDVESLPDDLKPFYDEKGRIAAAVVRPSGGSVAMPPICPPGMFPTMMPPPGFPAHLAMAQQSKS